MARRLRRALGVAVAIIVAACGAGACGVGDAPHAQRAALGGRKTLFLDFAGATITAGASDDATAGVSQLGAASVPAFDAGIVAPAVAPAQLVDVLVDRVRTLYAPYALDVVTTAPVGEDHARVLVGGTAAVLSPPGPSGAAGLATLDCTDANPRSVGFAFSDSLSPKFGGPVALAAAIAHEAGHGFGLEHLVSPTDPMYSVGVPAQTLADLFALRFGAGSYSPFAAGGGSVPEACGRADPLDGAAHLGLVLGPRAPSSAVPTVAITFPPAVAALPPSVSLEVGASDDVSVRRVEVYRDLTLVAVLEVAPYTTTLALPAADKTRITVEVVDDEAQRASTALEVSVDPEAPEPCDDAHACAGGLACVASACTAVIAVDAGSALDAGGTDHDDGGCALAGRAPVGAPWLLGLAWLLARRARRATG